jgi:hypothetical protein
MNLLDTPRQRTNCTIRKKNPTTITLDESNKYFITDLTQDST